MALSEPNKRLVPISGLPDWPVADFHAAWSGQHAKFAREIPGLARYVQNHVIRVLWKGSDYQGECEGVAELTYRDGDSVASNMSGWAGLDDLLVDEARFLGKWSGCKVHDTTLSVPAQRRILYLLQRPQDISEQVLADSVAEAVADLAAIAPAYADATVEKLIRERPVLAHDVWPDWTIFVDLPVDYPANLTEPDGPVLAPLRALSEEAVAYLVYSEAKRLPQD